jgi:hypothetical protein
MRLSLELQATRRQAGQGNLSTFRFSWDMRHDPKPRLETTIHLARPINATIGAPSSPLGRLALESLPISVLFLSKQCTSQTTMVHASTAAAPPTRQRGAAPMRAGGNDRRFALFDSTFDLLLVLTIIYFSD